MSALDLVKSKIPRRIATDQFTDSKDPKDKHLFGKKSKHRLNCFVVLASKALFKKGVEELTNLDVRDLIKIASKVLDEYDNQALPETTLEVEIAERFLINHIGISTADFVSSNDLLEDLCSTQFRETADRARTQNGVWRALEAANKRTALRNETFPDFIRKLNDSRLGNR